MRATRPGLGLLLLLPIGLWMAAGFFLPMGTVAALSVQADTSVFAEIGFDLSLEHFGAILVDPYYLKILFDTLAMGVVVTLASALIGVPIALWLAGLPGRWRALGMAVVVIPLLTNVVVRSLGLMQALAPDGALATILALISGQDRVNLLFSHFAVGVALVQVFMPFLVLSLYDTLVGLDKRLDEAADSLGARPVTRFFTVTWPQLLPGLRAGMSIVFLMATTAYVSASLLGGKKVFVAGMVVFEEAMQILNYPFASAMAMILLVVTSLGVVLIDRMFARAMPWRSGRAKPVENQLASPLPEAFLSVMEWIAPSLRRALLVLGWIVLLYPLVLVVVNSVNNVPQATAGAWKGFTLRWYEQILNEGSFYLDAALISGQLALASTVAALALALPAAFAIVRHPPAPKGTLMALFMLPLALPGIAFAIGMLKLLQIFFLIPPFLGLVIVHAVLILPFVLSMLRTSVEALDPRLEEAAGGLGATPMRVFRHVVLPLMLPGLAAGGIVAFLISFGEVTVTAFLSSARMQTLPVRIYADAQFDVLPTINVVSTLMIVATIALLLLLNKVMPLDRVWQKR